MILLYRFNLNLFHQLTEAIWCPIEIRLFSFLSIYSMPALQKYQLLDILKVLYAVAKSDELSIHP